MAEIIENKSSASGKGKQRAKKHPVHIDMTPMVDLACLLLTFFMLTTAFSKPKIMEIVLPQKDKIDEKQEVDDHRAIHIIFAADDQIFYYNGKADPTKGVLPVMIKSNYGKDGLRKMLLARNKDLFEKIYFFHDSLTRGLGPYKHTLAKDSVTKELRKLRKADKEGPVVLIKAGEGATYGNLVDIIDEMSITNIAVHAITDLNYVEKKMLADALAGKNVEVQK